MKTIRVGIMSKEEYKQRTINIAKGLYVPKSNEPKVKATQFKVEFGFEAA